MTSEGLKARGFLSKPMEDNLVRMQDLASKLLTISKKELQNESLTVDEYELIKTYGGQLEHFWLEVNAQEMQKVEISQENYLDQNPAALVADVATDPNGQVLEEGTGYVKEILAIVPVEGKLKIVSGGVFSHYEFAWPLNDRLTDEKWRQILRGDIEGMPNWSSWTSVFVANP